MQEYRGDYAVDVPPGKHEIKIENTGNDWLTLSRISIENYGWQPPSVQAMGLRGRDTVLLWLRNRDYTWFGNMAKQPCRTIEGAGLAVGGMQHGRHTVRLFDSQTASWVGAVQQCEARWGVIRLDLPPLRYDLAIVVAGRAVGG